MNHCEKRRIKSYYINKEIKENKNVKKYCTHHYRQPYLAPTFKIRNPSQPMHSRDILRPDVSLRIKIQQGYDICTCLFIIITL